MSSPILTLKFRKPRAFRYFWIKYVRGFDPRVHCARCLIGDYSRHMAYMQHRDLDGMTLDEFESPFIYICGVTAKWKWNMHVAGHLENGAHAEYRDARVEMRIENFKRIEIVAEGNPPAPREFATCRNWQFGWTAFPGTPRQMEFEL